MRHPHEIVPARMTADYTVRHYEDEQGYARVIDVRGRYPEAGSELTSVALKIIRLEGDGKVIKGSIAEALGRIACCVDANSPFSIEGSPVTVLITPASGQLPERLKYVVEDEGAII